MLELDESEKTVWWYAEQHIYKMVSGPDWQHPLGRYKWVWESLGSLSRVVT
jgi:hypothetical protein